MSNDKQALKDFRERYKLTQKQAADELGYNLRTWQDYEQGRLPIRFNLIKHIELYDKWEEFGV